MIRLAPLAFSMLALAVRRRVVTDRNRVTWA